MIVHWICKKRKKRKKLNGSLMGIDPWLTAHKNGVELLAILYNVY